MYVDPIRVGETVVFNDHSEHVGTGTVLGIDPELYLPEELYDRYIVQIHFELEGRPDTAVVVPAYAISRLQ